MPAHNANKGKYRTGSVHESKNCGKVEVISYIDYKYRAVRFLDTGFVTKCAIHNLLYGKVNDPTAPSVYGVGYLDGIKIPARGGDVRRIYDLWANMLKRCYGGYKTSYTGCTVDKRWHSFKTFLNTFQDIPNSEAFLNKEDVHLDKDILVQGNKEYSLSTCQFVSAEENVADSLKRRWAKD